MKISHRTLLFDEPPIAISPTLCRLISLQAAVLLQQLHYWLQQKAASPDRYRDHLIDGRYWVYWTQEQLQRAVPLGRSVDPHKRLIKELSAKGILLVAQHRAATWDRTNFYSIDYQRFDDFIAQRIYNGATTSGNPADRRVGVAHIDAEESIASMSAIASNYKCTERTTETSSEKTTTTMVVDKVMSSQQQIHLLPAAERYRVLIERSVAGLSSELAQDVADEVSGTIEAISLGKRNPVHGFAQWVPALAKSARNGELVPQYGPDVARTRMVAGLKSKDKQDRDQEVEATKARLSNDAQDATLVLGFLDDDALAWAAKAAAEKFPIQKMRAGIADVILRRQLPAGLGRAEAIDVLKTLRLTDGRGS